MILSLRQRHRRMFAVIGLLLPIAFGLGIAARKPVPSMAALPSELTGSPGHFTTPVWERQNLFAKVPVRVRLWREATGSGRLAVSLSAPPDFAKPDLIVYWVAGPPIRSDAVPDNARLLGGFDSTALTLPDDAATTDGSLILFSLADQEIVDVSNRIPF